MVPRPLPPFGSPPLASLTAPLLPRSQASRPQDVTDDGRRLDVPPARAKPSAAQRDCQSRRGTAPARLEKAAPRSAAEAGVLATRLIPDVVSQTRCSRRRMALRALLMCFYYDSQKREAPPPGCSCSVQGPHLCARGGGGGLQLHRAASQDTRARPRGESGARDTLFSISCQTYTESERARVLSAREAVRVTPEPRRCSARPAGIAPPRSAG